MCGRYQLDANKEEIQKYYGYEMTAPYKPRYNIAPQQDLPVVTEEKIELKKWDFPLKFGDKVVRKLINIRDDSLEKAWAKRYVNSRCLIPSTGYYEWKKTSDGKVPYYFGLDKHAIFSLAGLYQDDTFAIITTTPSDQAAEVHNRMPVIIERDHEKAWLNVDNEFSHVKQLIKPYSHKLLMYPISPSINNAHIDNPDVVQKQ